MSTALVVLAFLVVLCWPTGSKRVAVHASITCVLFALVGAAVVLEKGWP